MYNITVINDSTLDNNPKNFQVKDWIDLCEKLFEKLRDDDNEPLSENEKDNIRNNVRFELKEGLKVNLSEIIDLSTGNFYSSAATPIKPTVNLISSMATGAVKSILPNFINNAGFMNNAAVKAKKGKKRYYQWD